MRLRFSPAVGIPAFVACALLLSTGLAAGAANAETLSVELASGLTFEGTLSGRSLRLESRLGTFEVPPAELQRLVCCQPQRVVQAISTRDGDWLVGKLAAPSLHFTTEAGKAVEVKLSQINRIARRGGATPGTRPASTSPVLRSVEGDQIAITAPDSVNMLTRRGMVRFRPDQLDHVTFVGEGLSSHRVVTTDGSTLTGLVTGEAVTVRPKHLSTTDLKVPINVLAEFEFSSRPATGAAGPKLDLTGGDVLRGAPQGTLTLQTELGPLPITAGDIVSITPAAQSAPELSISLADGRTVIGAPSEAPVECRLDCGARVDVPVEAIAGYVKSAPGFVRLAATPDHSSGLTVLQSEPGGDGACVLDEKQGVPCWRSRGYLYFAIDEKLRPWPAPASATDIEVEYFDGGAGDVHLEYDSTDASLAFNGAYKVNANAGHRADTGRWRTAQFRIADARFSRAQNLHADFRIQHAGDELCVRSVRVLRGQP